MSATPSETMSVREAADRAGKSERTILLWMQQGHVGYHGEKPRRVDRASLETYLYTKARKEAGNFGNPSETPPPLPAPDLARVLEELAEVRAQLAEVLARLPPRASLAETSAAAPTAIPAEVVAVEAAATLPNDLPQEDRAVSLWARVGRWWRGKVVQ